MNPMVFNATNGLAPNILGVIDIGFKELAAHCMKTYPFSQPLCVEWEKTYSVENEAEPLKYIYIFRNPGDHNTGVPSHWHYVGFGLSDIHGYQIYRQLHEQLRKDCPAYKGPTLSLPDDIYPANLNGFGFELTFRLKCNSDAEWNDPPPVWPRKIMQDLARYVFKTWNTFEVGDHVAWHSPLDSDDQDEDTSRIKHILMTLDPQLGVCKATMGEVKFIQMIGVCDEELQAAREWNVKGILDIMSERLETGGKYLVTDMRRGETLFELNPDNQDRLEKSIRQMGSNMAKICALYKTSYTRPDWYTTATCLNENHTAAVMEDDNASRTEPNQAYPVRAPSRMSLGSESGYNYDCANAEEPRYYKNMYILLSEESARVLPVMLNGCLAHKRAFTFQSYNGDSLMIFQSEGTTLPHIPNFVNKQRPFGERGTCLQIYISDGLRELMYEALSVDFSRADKLNDDAEASLKLPKNYSWPEFGLYLTIVKELIDDQ